MLQLFKDRYRSEMEAMMLCPPNPILSISREPQFYFHVSLCFLRQKKFQMLTLP